MKLGNSERIMTVVDAELEMRRRHQEISKQQADGYISSREAKRLVVGVVEEEIQRLMRCGTLGIDAVADEPDEDRITKAAEAVKFYSKAEALDQALMVLGLKRQRKLVEHKDDIEDSQQEAVARSLQDTEAYMQEVDRRLDKLDAMMDDLIAREAQRALNQRIMKK